MGDEKGFFNPNADITRAQFVQVLYNAVAPEDYTPAELTFRDVPRREVVHQRRGLGLGDGRGGRL